MTTIWFNGLTDNLALPTVYFCVLTVQIYTQRTILSIEAENVDHSCSIEISSVNQLGVWKE